MNCKNCPYNNQADAAQKRPVIKHTQGNYLQLNIPLTIKWHTVTDGVEDIGEQGTIDRTMDVSVLLVRGKKEYRYEPTIMNNQLTIYEYGQLPVGTYDIIIVINDDGRGLRYKQRPLLMVVDETIDGQQYEQDEINVLAVYPVVEGKTTAISISPDEVVLSEKGKYTGDNTPTDGYADIKAAFGDRSIEIGEDEVTINI